MREAVLADPVPAQLRHPSAAPVNVVPITPPVEATLRILLNSVPYLIGAAVVGQPAVGDSVMAQVGRMPWLHDRRLTTLQLPDDALPANRAVALDWPVPYQAEWVGAPPRLVISRLVAQGRTVGVLLGTLITREQMSAQSREAVDLSCELIASAVASESIGPFAAPRAPVAAAPEPERAEESPERAPAEPALGDERSRAVIEEATKAVASAADARSMGRALRDAVNALTNVDAFSLSLFQVARRDVAYRYKVLSADPVAAEIGKQAVDDGPDCYAARRDRRWHSFNREIAVREQNGVSGRAVSVVQMPLVSADEVFGIATLQAFGENAFANQEIRLVLRLLEGATDRLAGVRRAGRFQPSPSPLKPAAAAVLPPAAAAPPVTPEPPSTERILKDLLAACAEAGLPTAFMVGVDPGAGVVRGELASGSDAARELDYAVGVSTGRFQVPLEDRYNAIARACREARIVAAPTLQEIVLPAIDENEAQRLERLVKGGRTVVVPLVVTGEVVGALVVGPNAAEPSFSAIERVRELVDDTTRRLAALWGNAS